MTAVDNFVSFKKLMAKRNTQLNEEAIKMLQEAEAGPEYTVTEIKEAKDPFVIDQKKSSQEDKKTEKDKKEAEKKKAAEDLKKKKQQEKEEKAKLKEKEKLDKLKKKSTVVVNGQKLTIEQVEELEKVKK